MRRPPARGVRKPDLSPLRPYTFTPLRPYALTSAITAIVPASQQTRADPVGGTNARAPTEQCTRAGYPADAGFSNPINHAARGGRPAAVSLYFFFVLGFFFPPFFFFLSCSRGKKPKSRAVSHQTQVAVPLSYVYTCTRVYIIIPSPVHKFLDPSARAVTRRNGNNINAPRFTPFHTVLLPLAATITLPYAYLHADFKDYHYYHYYYTYTRMV